MADGGRYPQYPPIPTDPDNTPPPTYPPPPGQQDNASSSIPSPDKPDAAEAARQAQKTAPYPAGPYDNAGQGPGGTAGYAPPQIFHTGRVSDIVLLACILLQVA